MSKFDIKPKQIFEAGRRLVRRMSEGKTVNKISHNVLQFKCMFFFSLFIPYVCLPHNRGYQKNEEADAMLSALYVYVQILERIFLDSDTQFFVI